MTKTIPHRILAIDPGITIGWALFLDGEATEMDEIQLGEFTYWLEDSITPDLIVVEDYKLFKHLALQQSGSHLETVRCIGIIESYTTRYRVPLIKQPSGILPIAERWTDTRRPLNHAKGHNKICAYLHGEYYMIKNHYKEVDFNV